MKKVKISITQWPGGIGIDIGNENGSRAVAGVHGGGVGQTIKSWAVDADELVKIIQKEAYEVEK